MAGSIAGSNRLTVKKINSLTKPGKYSDGNGLILRVTVYGSKSWIQRLTIQGKRCDLGLGSYPLVSLADARNKALQNLKIAREGGNPTQERLETQTIPTFEQAALSVYESQKPTWRNAKHSKQYLSTLKTYVFPLIGSKKVSEISTSDLLEVLQPIWLKIPETARRIKQRINSILKWSIAKGWRTDNPTITIAEVLPKQGRQTKHHKSLPYLKVQECLNDIKRSNAGVSTKLALELIILTACRSGEVRLSTWSEFDLVKYEWKIPSSRMKAKKEHRVPLSREAVTVLQAAENLSDGSGYVFPGTKGGSPLSDMTLSKLVKELGYDITVHGFRTTFRVWAQEKTDIPREVVEKALAHTIQNKVEAAYARSDLYDKRQILMREWAQFVSGKTFKPRGTLK